MYDFHPLYFVAILVEKLGKREETLGCRTVVVDPIDFVVCEFGLGFHCLFVVFRIDDRCPDVKSHPHLHPTSTVVLLSSKRAVV